MRTGKKYLSRGAPFLALWVLIAAGLLAVPSRGDPDQEFSTAAAAAPAPPPGIAAQLAATDDQVGPPGVASEADRRYQAARRAQRLGRIAFVAVLVFVPPFVLLVLGWVVSWVIRSFRSA